MVNSTKIDTTRCSRCTADTSLFRCNGRVEPNVCVRSSSRLQVANFIMRINKLSDELYYYSCTSCPPRLHYRWAWIIKRLSCVRAVPQFKLPRGLHFLHIPSFTVFFWCCVSRATVQQTLLYTIILTLSLSLSLLMIFLSPLNCTKELIQLNQPSSCLDMDKAIFS